MMTSHLTLGQALVKPRLDAQRALYGRHPAGGLDLFRRLRLLINGICLPAGRR